MGHQIQSYTEMYTILNHTLIESDIYVLENINTEEFQSVKNNKKKNKNKKKPHKKQKTKLKINKQKTNDSYLKKSP